MAGYKILNKALAKFLASTISRVYHIQSEIKIHISLYFQIITNIDKFTVYFVDFIE